MPNRANREIDEGSGTMAPPPAAVMTGPEAHPAFRSILIHDRRNRDARLTAERLFELLLPNALSSLVASFHSLTLAAAQDVHTL